MSVLLPKPDRLAFRMAVATAVAVAWLLITVGMTAVLAELANTMAVISTLPFCGTMLAFSIEEAKPFFSWVNPVASTLNEPSIAMQIWMVAAAAAGLLPNIKTPPIAATTASCASNERTSPGITPHPPQRGEGGHQMTYERPSHGRQLRGGYVPVIRLLSTASPR
jgi:hypothetical protein